MRVLLVNYRFYHSGGPEQYMFNVMSLLKDAGHEVVPFSVRSNRNEPSEYERYFPKGRDAEGNDSFDSIKKSPANVAHMVECAFFSREAYGNLRRLIRDERPDVVYVLQQVNALSPSVFKACSDEGVRVVHRLSDFNMICPRFDCLCSGEICIACSSGNYFRAIEKRCCHGSLATTLVRIASMKYHKARRLFDFVDAFVCPTESTAAILRASGVGASRIAVIPTFAPDPPGDGRAVRPESGYALYLGRISPEKGVADLVEAAISRPLIRLKIAGAAEGAYASSLIARVAAAGASDRIQFIGSVQGEAKEELLFGASCVCCPSKWLENMPNVVLEAYAHARPVVAYKAGCMPEIVRDGETGLVVRLGDIEALGGSVSRLLENQELSKDLGENGLALARSVYSPERHLEKLLDVLRGVSDGRKE